EHHVVALFEHFPLLLLPIRPIFLRGVLYMMRHQLIQQRRYPLRFVKHELVMYKTDRKSTRLNSSHRTISYAVFCLKKKKHESKAYCEDVQRPTRHENCNERLPLREDDSKYSVSQNPRKVRNSDINIPKAPLANPTD